MSYNTSDSFFNSDEPDIDEEPAVDPKRFMMSVITASPPQEDDGGKYLCFRMLLPEFVLAVVWKMKNSE